MVTTDKDNSKQNVKAKVNKEIISVIVISQRSFACNMYLQPYAC